MSQYPYYTNNQKPAPNYQQPTTTNANYQNKSPKQGLNPCCCDLRNGVLCAAIYGIVFYSFTTIFSILHVANVVTVYRNVALESLELEDDIDIKIVGYVGVASNIIGFIFAIVLTVGAVSKSSLLVKIGYCGYIFMFFLDTLLTFLYMLGCTVVLHGAMYGGPVSVWFYVTFGLGMLIHIAIYFYVLSAIFAYAKQLTRSGGKVTPVGTAPSYGKYPASPPSPNPQQSYYQPTVPNMGYSQTPMMAESQIYYPQSVQYR